MDLFSAYLDAELAPEEREQVAAHLESCGDCSREMELLGSLRRALRSMPVLEPPVPLLAGVRGRHRRQWGWAAATAAAVALATALAVAPGQQPSVLDIDTLADQHTARLVVNPGISTIRGPVGGP